VSLRLPFSVIPFDRENDAHCRFVYDAVRKRAHDWPYHLGDVDWLVETARRATVSNPRGCVLAADPGNSDTFYGYVLTDAADVVMAYTKQALRGPGAFEAPIGTPRAPGLPPVCTLLLEAVGIHLDRPTAVRIWSPAASRIAARGYQIFPAIPKH
jgi:hypothetical protein